MTTATQTDRPEGEGSRLMTHSPRTEEDAPPRKGIYIGYWARVPRQFLGAAIAEAFAIIERETQQQDSPPADG